MKKTAKIDVQNMVTIDSSIEEREKFNIGNIWSNSLKCLKCNDVIRSCNRHDYVSCSCRSCSIDGGSWYTKVSGNPENYELMTVLFKNISS